MIPRVTAAGRTAAVTLLNLSVGDTEAFDVRLRRPEAADVTAMSARGGMVPLATRPGDRDDEILVRVPNLGGWQILTVFCSASEEPGKGN